LKFKELPEGYYYVTDINHLSETVYVQRLEEPETMPRYVLELDTIKVEPGGRDYNKKSNRSPSR